MTESLSLAELLRRVERREYAWCHALYHDPDDDECWVHGVRPRWEPFLVWTPRTKEARQRAHAYATARWGEPVEVHVYPRNYIASARDLVAIGRYEQMPEVAS